MGLAAYKPVAYNKCHTRLNLKHLKQRKKTQNDRNKVDRAKSTSAGCSAKTLLSLADRAVRS